jgi:hypothetical protein
LRRQDAGVTDWSAFSNRNDFAKYAAEIVASIDCSETASWHPACSNNDYVIQKVTLPMACKMPLYPLSGQRSIQIKMVRAHSDPPEGGFEILRVNRHASPMPMVLHEIWWQGSGHDGWLGAFCSPHGVFLR